MKRNVEIFTRRFSIVLDLSEWRVEYKNGISSENHIDNRSFHSNSACAHHFKRNRYRWIDTKYFVVRWLFLSQLANLA